MIKRYLTCEKYNKELKLHDYKGDMRYDEALIDLQRYYLGCTDCEHTCPPVVRYKDCSK